MSNGNYNRGGNRGNNYGGGNGGQYNPPRFRPAVEVKSFYENDGKLIKADLFDNFAATVAKSFTDEANKIGVTSTQLRRIFDEVKRFERSLSLANITDQEGQVSEEAKKTNWNNQLPYIKMIKSKVAYAVARAIKQKSNEKQVYENLSKFIGSCIDKINSEQDYHVFVSLFEAVYGFYYQLAPNYCRK